MFFRQGLSKLDCLSLMAEDYDGDEHMLMASLNSEKGSLLSGVGGDWYAYHNNAGSAALANLGALT